MKRPMFWIACRQAQRNASLRRSNDHLRMSLTAALKGESVALQQVRDLEAERDLMDAGLEAILWAETVDQARGLAHAAMHREEYHGLPEVSGG